MTDEDLESEYGHLPSQQTDAAVHVGGLLFLARSSRPDMMFATGFLGRYVSKWSLAAEKRMKRLFEYLESTLNYVWPCVGNFVAPTFLT